MSYRSESNTTGWFVGVIFALALLAIAYLSFAANSPPEPKRYDTDPPDGTSLLWPYTDALTGCQYLAVAYQGVLTPRMGPDGKQICVK